MNCPIKRKNLNYSLKSGYSVDFTAYAPFHTFKGWVKEGIEAEICLDPETLTPISAKAVAATNFFDTGDERRNIAMKEYMDVDSSPIASMEMSELKSFKQLGDGIYKANVLAVLEFMGEKRQLPLKFTMKLNDEGLMIDLKFKWSFKAYGFKAPSLLFMKVRDIVDISANGDFVISG